MQSCQFAKSVTLNVGQECSAPHGLLSFRRLRSSRPCFPLQLQTVQDAGNEAHSGASASVTVLEHTMLFSHVLGLRTPILRQGDVTDSFYSVHFFRKLWKVLFFLDGHMHCLLHGELLSISPFRRVGSEFRLCLLRLISTDAFLATHVDARKFYSRK